MAQMLGKADRRGRECKYGCCREYGPAFGPRGNRPRTRRVNRRRERLAVARELRSGAHDA